MGEIWDTKEEKPLLQCGSGMGMNTTELIKQWSMSGALRDDDGRFRSIDDIRAILVARSQPTTAAASSLLMKRPGEEDWEPLLLGEGVAGASN